MSPDMQTRWLARLHRASPSRQCDNQVKGAGECTQRYGDERLSVEQNGRLMHARTSKVILLALCHESAVYFQQHLYGVPTFLILQLLPWCLH